VRQHHGSDARVVVDHLGLRGARVGIEHFVEVAQTQATPPTSTTCADCAMAPG
jgi:hypothetical protein